MNDTARRERARDEAPCTRSDLTESGLRSMVREAAASPDREVYHAITASGPSRIGLTVTIADSGAPSFTLVAIFDLFDVRATGSRDGRVAAAGIRRMLARRGYVTSRLENGWVSLERTVPRDRVLGEWRLLERHLGGAPPGRRRHGQENGTHREG